MFTPTYFFRKYNKNSLKFYVLEELYYLKWCMFHSVYNKIWFIFGTFSYSQRECILFDSGSNIIYCRFRFWNNVINWPFQLWHKCNNTPLASKVRLTDHYIYTKCYYTLKKNSISHWSKWCSLLISIIYHHHRCRCLMAIYLDFAAFAFLPWVDTHQPQVYIHRVLPRCFACQLHLILHYCSLSCPFSINVKWSRCSINRSYIFKFINISWF